MLEQFVKDYCYLGALHWYIDFIKRKRKEQLNASELLLEQSPLDKAQEEIVEKKITAKDMPYKTYIGETLNEQ